MPLYRIEYETICSGECFIEADSRDEARRIFDLEDFDDENEVEVTEVEIIEVKSP